MTGVLTIGLILIIAGALVIAALTTGADDDWRTWWAERRAFREVREEQRALLAELHVQADRALEAERDWAQVVAIVSEPSNVVPIQRRGGSS